MIHDAEVAASAVDNTKPRRRSKKRLSQFPSPSSSSSSTTTTYVLFKSFFYYSTIVVFLLLPSLLPTSVSSAYAPPPPSLRLSCGPPPHISGAHLIAQHLSPSGDGRLFDWVRYACDDAESARLIPTEGAVVVCRKRPSTLQPRLGSPTSGYNAAASLAPYANMTVWGFSPVLSDAGIPNLPMCLSLIAGNDTEPDSENATSSADGNDQLVTLKASARLRSRDSGGDLYYRLYKKYTAEEQQEAQRLDEADLLPKSNRLNRGMRLAVGQPRAGSANKRSRKKLELDFELRKKATKKLKQAGDSLQFLPVTCGPPPEIPFSVVVAERIADGFRMGRPYDWVRYGCIEGYQLVGSAVVVCLVNGRWMNAKESLPICSLAPPITNSPWPATTLARSFPTTHLPTATPATPEIAVGRSTSSRFDNHLINHHSSDLALARLLAFIDEWSRSGTRPNFSPPTPSIASRATISSSSSSSSRHTYPTVPATRSRTTFTFPTVPWTRPPPTAVSSITSRTANTRRAVTCGPPPYIPDAIVVGTSLRSVHDFGYPRDWFKIECPTKFEIISSDTVICTPDGRWMNEYSTLPICIMPGYCDPPPEYPLSTVEYISLSPGATATYYCSEEKDYAMVGTSNVATCQRNATWTTPDFECLLNSLPTGCNKPPLVRYGTITRQVRYNHFGWSAAYRCDNELFGEHVLRCHPYRGWARPRKCPPPPKVSYP